MPKLEAKIVQRELELGLLWPVYWIYGEEKMKSRELLKRIRKAVLGEEGKSNSIFGLSEETLDASQADGATVLEASQSLSLGGGLKFIVVRDAHQMKEPEPLVSLLGPKRKKEELSSVCVFISKDLDGRKKFSKSLVEGAAVVACEDVPELEREAWIGYLSKRRGLNLPPESVVQLATLDPWTLDIIDQELEKIFLEKEEDVQELLLEGKFSYGGAGGFLDCFFARDLKRSLEAVEHFANRPDEALPLLGLFAWNVRHLALWVSAKAAGSGGPKINPYAAEKLRRWSASWKRDEILELQQALMEVDLSLKQTPLLPLGIWTEVVTRFCRGS